MAAHSRFLVAMTFFLLALALAATGPPALSNVPATTQERWLEAKKQVLLRLKQRLDMRNKERLANHSHKLQQRPHSALLGMAQQATAACKSGAATPEQLRACNKHRSARPKRTVATSAGDLLSKIDSHTQRFGVNSTALAQRVGIQSDTTFAQRWRDRSLPQRLALIVLAVAIFGAWRMDCHCIVQRSQA